MDPLLITILREPLFREEPSITEWEVKQGRLEKDMEDSLTRQNVAFFFETLAKRKDANYRVSINRFDNIKQLLTFLASQYEKQGDFVNCAKMLYFTQYFCFYSDEEKRYIWLAEKFQDELPIAKKQEFWEKTLTWLIYVCFRLITGTSDCK